MCTTCGCAAGETRIEGEALQADEHQHPHVHADGTVHSHSHAHDGGHAHDHGDAAVAAAHLHEHRHADGSVHSHPHVHAGEHHHGHAYRPQKHGAGEQGNGGHGGHSHGDGVHDYGTGPAGAHAPGMTQARMVQIERDILSKNDGYAAGNRQRFAERGIFALNLVSSPGSGKTTLLVRTIEALKGKFPIAVIEGDQQTSFDAERIRSTGVPALQINTGKGCHLDAHMVGHALESLDLADDSLLLIENVGNLVCPAAFDLGEAAKVVILSVTEGEDKPLKYPDMFRAAGMMLLNKVDLLPHLTFDAALAVDYARRVNPALEVIHTSSASGEGFDAWLAWIERGVADARAQKQETVDALKRRVAELEARLAQR